MNAILHARPLPAPVPSGGQLARRRADCYADRVTGQFTVAGHAADLRPLPRALPSAQTHSTNGFASTSSRRTLRATGNPVARNRMSLARKPSQLAVGWF